MSLEITPDVKQAAMCRVLACLIRASKPEIGGLLVVDETGYPGRYDFELTWSQETLASETNEDAGGTSLFTALQEQLGLKVEDRKAPVDCIVIDHVEMPSKD